MGNDSLKYAQISKNISIKLLDNQFHWHLFYTAVDPGTCIAYQDIQILKILLGDIKNAGKEWHRHRVISMVMEAFEMAKLTQDPKAMIMAADKLGKYTRLDKEDAVTMPWDEIIPLPVEPTNDPTLSLDAVARPAAT